MDLDAVYREHAKTVYRFLLSKTGSSEAAEELTQETFFQAVRTVDRFDGSCQVITWLCGIAKNVHLTWLRKTGAAPLPLEEAPEPAGPSAEAQVLGQLDRQTLYRQIHSQPEPGRELLYLRLLGGLSFREIGGVMGQSENWARVNYYRAKQKLRKELTEE